MSRSRRIANRAEWKKRLARYAKSNQTVAQFCLDELVSEPSFYYWRKRLLPQPTETLAAPALFHPVHVVSSFSTVSARPTIVRVKGLEIELGSDPAVVEAVIHQLLEATGMTPSDEGESC
jgi:hypothetical protein